VTSLLLPPSAVGPVQVVRRRDQLDRVDDRRLARSLRAGEWVRVTADVFARGAEWARATPLERHRVRVVEIAHRLHAPGVLSHSSAAAWWGIDLLGAWPAVLEVTTARASGGRSRGDVRRHAFGLEGVERVPFGRHEITTPAQTALDLARSLPFAKAVAAVDQAVWTGRPGGPLTTIEEIEELHREAPRRGNVRARRVLGFASTLAANVRESELRVLVMALGFPPPRVQERRVLRSGRLVFGDLYFPEDDHWLELDGRGKYLSPQFGPERDPGLIVIDEKNRENEIRREVRGFSRLEPADLDDPSRVYDILTGDGLRSRLPRP